MTRYTPTLPGLTRRFLAAAVVALLSPAMLVAQGTEPAQTETAPQEERPAPAGEGEGPPPGELVVQEEVFVEGRLPDVPTSNTVAAKLPLALAETPASVTVVEAPRLEEQGAVILGDALENAAGVHVQTGNGVFDFFVVRGLDSVSSGLILTDGAPEPETTFYQLYNVERVEVLKGPSSFLYGGSPLGGTVNLVRRQPAAGRFLRAGVSAGSWSTFEATLDANTASADGNLSFRVHALGRESDGYRDDKESEVFGLNPALTWRPGESTAVHFNLEVLSLDHSPDAGLPILFTGELPDVPRRRSYQSPLDVSDQDLGRFQVDVETRLSDRFTLRNKLYWRSLDWLSRSTIFAGVFPDPAGSLQAARTLLTLDDRQDFLGDQLELVGRLGSGGVTHHLLLGLETQRLDDEFTFGVELLPSIDLFDPVETAQEPLFALPGGFAADAESRVLAPYAVDQIGFGDKVRLLLGARWDRVDFEDRTQGLSRNDGELSPMAGVVVLPLPSLSLYASYGEAFAPPSTFVVGEERAPEESRQIELGAKKSFLGGRLRTTFALYRLERENIAIPDDGGVTRQTGDQRSEGFEVELAAEPASGLAVFFHYAFDDAELTEFRERLLVSFDPPLFLTFDRSGNTPAFAPRHLAGFWLRQRFDGGFAVAGGGRWVDEQFIAEDNAFTLDGYLTFDAALFYDLGHWGLELHLDNLTGEEYLTRGFGGTSVIPAPGFGASLGFRYRR